MFCQETAIVNCQEMSNFCNFHEKLLEQNLSSDVFLSLGLVEKCEDFVSETSKSQG